jgi:outer membrane receptor protein involved in Fe transport
VPYFPRWIVNLSSDWSKPLATSKNLRFRVDYQHRAKTFSSFNPSAIDYVELPASDMVNAQLSLETAAWDLVLYARNLTDERQVTQVIPNAGGPRPSDEFFYARPRTFGVSARVRF